MEYIDTDSPLRLGRVQVPEELAALVRALEPGEGFQLELAGRVVGAVISSRDLDLYLTLLREYEDKVDGEAADKAIAEGGEPIPIEALMEEFGIKVNV
jgi:hypothetical protein